MRNRVILCVTCVLMVTAAIRADVRFETISEGIQLGRISVPENRSAGTDRTITLAFARLASTAKTPGAPIVYLSGGPGQPATPMARNAGSVARFAALREIGDVILLDQRGTGLSEPSLRCPEGEPPPLDAFTDAKANARGRVILACMDALGARGIDLGAYNTRESADDIDDLRRALGAPKVSLVAFSYGTHLALAAMRRHGRSLERVVLLGTEGPDHTWKLPSTYDTHIARLARMAAADPAVAKDVPDFEALLRRVVAKLSAEPVTVRVRDARTKSDIELPVGATALRRFLLQDFGDTSDLPHFPAMIHQLDRGETALFSWFVEKRWNGLGRGSAMYFAMDCASGVSPARRARIDQEARHSVMGNEMNAGYSDLCPQLGIADLGEEFRQPVVTGVPALFISGALDANTPPFQAEELRWGFTSSTHLVVENAGHEQTLPEPAVQKAIVDFLKGTDVRGRTIALPPVKFVPVTTPRR
ncbi:MAG TPA: alpha/beta fold hydrolase [Thermoanaerobaculia bacterium]|nr:alpha/beta fold hydrolase [Thermoanaerobaculia bacterium]